MVPEIDWNIIVTAVMAVLVLVALLILKTPR
jgi:hypothetical protein